MKCPKCGATNTASATVCKKCGAKLSGTKTTTKTAKPSGRGKMPSSSGFKY